MICDIYLVLNFRDQGASLDVRLKLDYHCVRRCIKMRGMIMTFAGPGIAVNIPGATVTGPRIYADGLPHLPNRTRWQ